MPSLPQGYTLGRDGSGIVLVRAEFVDRHGEPDTLALFFGKRIALKCTREENREEYQLSPVGDGQTVDFYVALPPGIYRYYDPTRRDHNDMLRFEIRPGVVECLGTIRFRNRGAWAGGVLDLSLHDDCDAIVQRFRTSHPEVTQEVVREPFRKYTYDWQDRVWVPQP